jgi:Putative bacterial sensory transduction regulator
MGRLVTGTVVSAVAVVLLLGSGTPGDAQERGSLLSGHRALEILREEGHSATLDTDSQGDPMIVFYVRGAKCQLLFYDCEGRRCGSVTFHVGFRTSGPDRPRLSRVNEWNRKRRFGKVYLDDELDPILECDVAFAGGEAREQFTAAIARWQSLLAAFREFFF